MNEDIDIRINPQVSKIFRELTSYINRECKASGYYLKDIVEYVEDTPLGDAFRFINLDHNHQASGWWIPGLGPISVLYHTLLDLPEYVGRAIITNDAGVKGDDISLLRLCLGFISNALSIPIQISNDSLYIKLHGVSLLAMKGVSKNNVVDAIVRVFYKLAKYNVFNIVGYDERYAEEVRKIKDPEKYIESFAKKNESIDESSSAPAPDDVLDTVHKKYFYPVITGIPSWKSVIKRLVERMNFLCGEEKMKYETSEVGDRIVTNIYDASSLAAVDPNGRNGHGRKKGYPHMETDGMVIYPDIAGPVFSMYMITDEMGGDNERYGLLPDYDSFDFRELSRGKGYDKKLIEDCLKWISIELWKGHAHETGIRGGCRLVNIGGSDCIIDGDTKEVLINLAEDRYEASIEYRDKEGNKRFYNISEKMNDAYILIRLFEILQSKWWSADNKGIVREKFDLVHEWWNYTTCLSRLIGRMDESVDESARDGENNSFMASNPIVGGLVSALVSRMNFLIGGEYLKYVPNGPLGDTVYCCVKSGSGDDTVDPRLGWSTPLYLNAGYLWPILQILNRTLFVGSGSNVQESIHLNIGGKYYHFMEDCKGKGIDYPLLRRFLNWIGIVVGRRFEIGYDNGCSVIYMKENNIKIPILNLNEPYKRNVYCYFDGMKYTANIDDDVNDVYAMIEVVRFVNFRKLYDISDAWAMYRNNMDRWAEAGKVRKDWDVYEAEKQEPYVDSVKIEMMQRLNKEVAQQLGVELELSYDKDKGLRLFSTHNADGTPFIQRLRYDNKPLAFFVYMLANSYEHTCMGLHIPYVLRGNKDDGVDMQFMRKAVRYISREIKPGDYGRAHLEVCLDEDARYWVDAISNGIHFHLVCLSQEYINNITALISLVNQIYNKNMFFPLYWFNMAKQEELELKKKSMGLTESMESIGVNNYNAVIQHNKKVVDDAINMAIDDLNALIKKSSVKGNAIPEFGIYPDGKWLQGRGHSMFDDEYYHQASMGMDNITEGWHTISSHGINPDIPSQSTVWGALSYEIYILGYYWKKLKAKNVISDVPKEMDLRLLRRLITIYNLSLSLRNAKWYRYPDDVEMGLERIDGDLCIVENAVRGHNIRAFKVWTNLMGCDTGDMLSSFDLAHKLRDEQYYKENRMIECK